MLALLYKFALGVWGGHVENVCFKGGGCDFVLCEGLRLNLCAPMVLVDARKRYSLVRSLKQVGPLPDT